MRFFGVFFCWPSAISAAVGAEKRRRDALYGHHETGGRDDDVDDDDDDDEDDDDDDYDYDYDCRASYDPEKGTTKNKKENEHCATNKKKGFPPGVCCSSAHCARHAKKDFQNSTTMKKKEKENERTNERTNKTNERDASGSRFREFRTAHDARP